MTLSLNQHVNNDHVMQWLSNKSSRKQRLLILVNYLNQMQNSKNLIILLISKIISCAALPLSKNNPDIPSARLSLKLWCMYRIFVPVRRM